MHIIKYLRKCNLTHVSLFLVELQISPGDWFTGSNFYLQQMKDMTMNNFPSCDSPANKTGEVLSSGCMHIHEWAWQRDLSTELRQKQVLADRVQVLVDLYCLPRSVSSVVWLQSIPSWSTQSV